MHSWSILFSLLPASPVHFCIFSGVCNNFFNWFLSVCFYPSLHNSQCDINYILSISHLKPTGCSHLTRGQSLHSGVVWPLTTFLTSFYALLFSHCCSQIGLLAVPFLPVHDSITRIKLNYVYPQNCKEVEMLQVIMTDIYWVPSGYQAFLHLVPPATLAIKGR